MTFYLENEQLFSVYGVFWCLILLTPFVEIFISEKDKSLNLKFFAVVTGMLCAATDPVIYRSVMLAIAVMYYRCTILSSMPSILALGSDSSFHGLQMEAKNALTKSFGFMSNMVTWFVLYVVLR